MSIERTVGKHEKNDTRSGQSLGTTERGPYKDHMRGMLIDNVGNHAFD